MLGNEISYFVNHETIDNTCLTEYDVISMFEFLFIINIFVQFAGHILSTYDRQIHENNLSFSLSIYSLYAYEAEFINLLKTK